MFKQSRPNSFIYILTKGQNPVLETGVVQSVSQPRMSQFAPSQQNPYQYPQPMVVDMVANVGQDKRNLNGLPADNDIFDFNGNVVVTLDKDKITNEIKILYKEQENIYNGHDKAKELMAVYSGMLASLNPEEAKAKEQADKIAYLESAMAKQTEMFNQTLQQMQAMMSQMAVGSNPKTSKAKEQ